MPGQTHPSLPTARAPAFPHVPQPVAAGAPVSGPLQLRLSIDQIPFRPPEAPPAADQSSANCNGPVPPQQLPSNTMSDRAKQPSMSGRRRASAKESAAKQQQPKSDSRRTANDPRFHNGMPRVFQSCRMMLCDRSSFPAGTVFEKGAAEKCSSIEQSEGDEEILIKSIDSLSEKVFGYSCEEVVGKDFFYLFHGDDQNMQSLVETKIAEVAKAMRKREKVTRFVNISHRTGKFVSVRLDLRPLCPAGSLGGRSPMHYIALMQIAAHADYTKNVQLFRELKLGDLFNRNVAEAQNGALPPSKRLRTYDDSGLDDEAMLLESVRSEQDRCAADVVNGVCHVALSIDRTTPPLDRLLKATGINPSLIDLICQGFSLEQPSQRETAV